MLTKASITPRDCLSSKKFGKKWAIHKSYLPNNIFLLNLDGNYTTYGVVVIYYGN